MRAAASLFTLLLSKKVYEVITFNMYVYSESVFNTLYIEIKL